MGFNTFYRLPGQGTTMVRTFVLGMALAVSLGSAATPVGAITPTDFDSPTLSLGSKLLEVANPFMTPDLTDEGGLPSFAIATLTSRVWYNQCNGLYTYELEVDPQTGMTHNISTINTLFTVLGFSNCLDCKAGYSYQDAILAGSTDPTGAGVFAIALDASGRMKWVVQQLSGFWDTDQRLHPISFFLQSTHAPGLATFRYAILNSDPGVALGYAPVSPPPPNQPPVANAGDDQTVKEWDVVTLDGSGSSDPEHNSLAFQWTQSAGPSVSLSSLIVATPTFLAPEVRRGGQTLTFQLTVCDGQLSSAGLVNISVMNVNHAPVAYARADHSVKEGSPVTLDGSDSYDPDAEEITYSWAQTQGPSVALSGQSSVKPSFTAPAVGPAGATLIFTLTVSDGMASAYDTVAVTVEYVNHQPIANAGVDQTRNEGSPVALDGTLSSDPDRDLLSYTWTQLPGTTVSLSNRYSPTPTFTAPQVGPGGQALVFQLVVNDGGLDSNPDTVTITVANVNDPPICSQAQAKPNILWPPNHKLIPVKIKGVTDPNNDRVTLTITGVTQDEPTYGVGDGDTTPDAALSGDKLNGEEDGKMDEEDGTKGDKVKVLLRAERAGKGNGRVYRVTFRADDGFGGSCTGMVTVCVPHDARASCIDDGQRYYNPIQP